MALRDQNTVEVRGLERTEGRRASRRCRAAPGRGTSSRRANSAQRYDTEAAAVPPAVGLGEGAAVLGPRA